MIAHGPPRTVAPTTSRSGRSTTAPSRPATTPAAARAPSGRRGGAQHGRRTAAPLARGRRRRPAPARPARRVIDEDEPTHAVGQNQHAQRAAAQQRRAAAPRADAGAAAAQCSAASVAGSQQIRPTSRKCPAIQVRQHEPAERENDGRHQPRGAAHAQPARPARRRPGRRSSGQARRSNSSPPVTGSDRQQPCRRIERQGAERRQRVAAAAVRIPQHEMPGAQGMSQQREQRDSSAARYRRRTGRSARPDTARRR